MKVRIYRSLLLMGIVSVITTFILSAILYYQGMQEQFSHELQHLNSVMAGAVSTDDEEEAGHISAVFMMTTIRPSISYGLTGMVQFSMTAITKMKTIKTARK